MCGNERIESKRTNLTPHHALRAMPMDVFSVGDSISRSHMSVTTRNILSARGISEAVYAVSAN